jgi:hypothetical protein
MKKALHLEPIEAAVKLQVAPLGVAQIKKAGYYSVELLPELEPIDGRVRATARKSGKIGSLKIG